MRAYRQQHHIVFNQRTLLQQRWKRANSSNLLLFAWWTLHATITPHLLQWHWLMWYQDKSATSMNANTIKWHDNNNRSAMTATMMEWPRNNDVVPSIPTPEHIIAYHYHDAYRSTHTIHRPAISLDTATYNSLDDATSHHQLDKLCIKSTAISLDTVTYNLTMH